MNILYRFLNLFKRKPKAKINDWLTNSVFLRYPKQTISQIHYNDDGSYIAKFYSLNDNIDISAYNKCLKERLDENNIIDKFYSLAKTIITKAEELKEENINEKQFERSLSSKTNKIVRANQFVDTGN